MFDVKEDIILGGLAGASSVAIDAFYYKTGFSTPVLYRGAIVGAGVILGNIIAEYVMRNDAKGNLTKGLVGMAVSPVASAGSYIGLTNFVNVDNSNYMNKAIRAGVCDVAGNYGAKYLNVPVANDAKKSHNFW